MKLQKQEYEEKPMCASDITGESSRAIFKFMVTQSEYLDIDKFVYKYPIDVDDWERNRALLLWFPEWKSRLTEMSIISNKWKILVNNWNEIERFYDLDYEKYGNKAYNEGQCNKYIRDLLITTKS